MPKMYMKEQISWCLYISLNIYTVMFRFRDKFSSRLQMLESQPFAFGNLTVRSLLDMREHCLMEFDFHDVYLKQKQLENRTALALLPAHLAKLAVMDWQQRQENLALGFLAGNVFDWGAKEVALLMEAGKLDFEAAMAHIGPRPWLMDDVDRWVERLKGPPHKCVCVFIDNSGGDFILGMQEKLYNLPIFQIFLQVFCHS